MALLGFLKRPRKVDAVAYDAIELDQINNDSDRERTVPLAVTTADSKP